VLLLNYWGSSLFFWDWKSTDN